MYFGVRLTDGQLIEHKPADPAIAVGKSNPAAKGMATDMITNQRLLDTFCYNNVFIDEGREALGVKKDFKTPLMYYKETVRSLEELIELVGE